ncbi:MAG: hypothetical protein V1800_10300 [Candidatus Latescibacterota bacterium]
MRKPLPLILMLALAGAMVGAALTYAGPGFHRGDSRQDCAAGPLSSLTEEQRAAIRETISTMEAEGASPEEIRAAVSQEYGIELPERRGPPYGGGAGPFSNLTEEQRAAIRETISTMEAEGALPEEIRAAVSEQYGIELPERRGPRHGRGEGPLSSLTEEQRAGIRAKVQEMKEADATREEIREAVRAMLAGYGVELPEGVSEKSTLDTTPSARISSTTAAKSATWGAVKSQMK